MPTGFRGQLQYKAGSGPNRTPSVPAVQGLRQQFLDGAPLAAVDAQPLLFSDTFDDFPRSYGYAWNGVTYPGPLAEGTTDMGLTVVSTTGAAGTFVTLPGLGGGIRIGSTAVDNTNIAITSQLVFPPTAGHRIWFLFRGSILEATLAPGEVLIGLANVVAGVADLATPPTAGIFFSKADTATTWNFQVRNAGASTSLTNVFALAGLAAPTTTTVFELGFLLDAQISPHMGAADTGAVSAYVNGLFVGSVAWTDANMPSGVNLGLCLERQAAADAATRTLDITQVLLQEEI